MKKLLLIFTIFIFCLNPAFASEFVPGNMNSFLNWGIGVYFVPNKYKIYEEPSKTSKILENIYYNEFGNDPFFSTLSAKNSYLTFMPTKKTVLLAVDSSDNEYISVFYNQKNTNTGWIEKTQEGMFYTWKNFMKEFGKKNGVYFFKDIPARYKRLYTSPDETAQLVNSKYDYIKEMKTVTVRGNWMLVRLIDIDRKTHIGWIKWRNENGKIMVFPDFSKDRYDF